MKPLFEGLGFSLHSKAVGRAGIEKNERSESGSSLKAWLEIAHQIK
jgi:hypothetical protein